MRKLHPIFQSTNRCTVQPGHILSQLQHLVCPNYHYQVHFSKLEGSNPMKGVCSLKSEVGVKDGDTAHVFSAISWRSKICTFASVYRRIPMSSVFFHLLITFVGL